MMIEGHFSNSPSGPLTRYRRRIYAASQEVHGLGVECRDRRITELQLFDEALALARKKAQRHAIRLVDGLSNVSRTMGAAGIADVATATGDTRLLARNALSDLLASNDEKIHRRHHDALDERNGAPLDSVWYALMELEAMLHERIIDSTKIFIATISHIIESFVGQCSQLFECARTACEYYFQATGLTAAAAANGGCDATGTMARDHHMRIIDMRMDAIQSLANKWLAKVIDQYEQ